MVPNNRLSDYLADPVDVGTLASAIGSELISSDAVAGYTHMDFTWSYTASDVIYPSIVKLLHKYNP